MSKEKALDIIEKSPVAFMATVDGKQPRVRPMQIKVIWNSCLYVSTFTSSHKIEQIKKNAYTEIVWMDKDMRHVRLAGSIVVCYNAELRRKFYEENQKSLDAYFKGVDDPNYTLLEIKPQKVEYMDIGDKEYHNVKFCGTAL